MANEHEKLRGCYEALVNLQEVFANQRGVLADGEFRFFAEEMRRAVRGFPDLLPPFEAEAFVSHRYKRGQQTFYHTSGIRTYIAAALGRLKPVVDSGKDTPFTERRDFAFVQGPALRRILERDYREMQRSYISACWKAVIILAGSSIEAILVDLLLQNSAAAVGATKAPPKEKDITRWHLNNLIIVAVELDLVTAGVEKLSHSVRDYRNLVHPGLEIREKLIFGPEEAKIALEVLHILHRDLSSRLHNNLPT